MSNSIITDPFSKNYRYNLNLSFLYGDKRKNTKYDMVYELQRMQLKIRIFIEFIIFSSTIAILLLCK